jgi:hypothetical protein
MNAEKETMPVTVQILDKDYRIACEPGTQHGLIDCARALDQRMREVRQNGRVIGADRIAVMAALNLIWAAWSGCRTGSPRRSPLARQPGWTPPRNRYSLASRHPLRCATVAWVFS